MSVYLARSADGSVLKIGTSRNVRARVSGLGAFLRNRIGRDCGRFTLLFSIPDSHTEEKEMLSRFREYRLHGNEWFRCEQEIIDAFAPSDAMPDEDKMVAVAIPSALHASLLARAEKQGMKLRKYVERILRAALKSKTA